MGVKSKVLWVVLLCSLEMVINILEEPITSIFRVENVFHHISVKCSKSLKYKVLRKTCSNYVIHYKSRFDPI
jgi:hypothetical protein